jgi:hypothetical protein
MAQSIRCNRAGFNYNDFLKVLDNANPDFNAKSSIKIFKKFYFRSNCGTWVKSFQEACFPESETTNRRFSCI